MTKTYQHVLGALNWLESHERNLHGKNGSNAIQDAVGNIDSVRESTSDHQ